MFLAFGIVSAMLHAQRTGQGQVVDCAMVDGAAVLMSMIWSLRAAGLWRDERGVNLLDTGAHFYDTYETADGKYLAVGAIEPQFLRNDAAHRRPCPRPRPRRANEHFRMAGPETKACRHLHHPHPRRMDVGLRRHGRLRLSRPVAGRSPGAPPQRRTRHVPHDRRRHPARPRPALFRHPAGSTTYGKRGPRHRHRQNPFRHRI